MSNAAALAALATGMFVVDDAPDLERTYSAVTETDADRARMAAAQAKRERKADMRLARTKQAPEAQDV